MCLRQITLPATGAAGNQQGDGLHGYQYDSEGRLERVTLGTGAGASSVQYAHNALGLRVFKTDVLAGASTTNTNTTSKAGQPRITLLGDEDEEQDQPGTNSPSAQGTQGASGPGSLLQNAKNFWLRLWSPQTDSTQAQGRAFVYAEDGKPAGRIPHGGQPGHGADKGSAAHLAAHGQRPDADCGGG